MLCTVERMLWPFLRCTLEVLSRGWSRAIPSHLSFFQTWLLLNAFWALRLAVPKTRNSGWGCCFCRWRASHSGWVGFSSALWSPFYLLLLKVLIQKSRTFSSHYICLWKSAGARFFLRYCLDSWLREVKWRWDSFFCSWLWSTPAGLTSLGKSMLCWSSRILAYSHLSCRKKAGSRSLGMCKADCSFFASMDHQPIFPSQ